MLNALISLPALNEEERIGGVLATLPSALGSVSSISVLVVDDGSTDRTAEIAEAAGATVIRHSSPRGVGGAFHSAVDYALRSGFDVLITIDADGQFDSRQIPQVVDPILRGDADFVTGSRFSEGRRPTRMPWSKYRGNQFFTRLMDFFVGRGLTDVSCGFRAYSREALYHLNLFGKFTYTQETVFDLAFKGLRIVEVPIRVTYDPNRQSRVARSLIRYGFQAMSIVLRTARDFKPLRFFGMLGLVVFLFGVALDVWMLVHFLRTGSFSPFKFVGFAGATLNLGGILVAGMALVADMLDRMRVNQERILYLQRRRAFPPGRPSPVRHVESADVP